MSRTLRSDLRSVRSRWDGLDEITQDFFKALAAAPFLFLLLGAGIAVLSA